MERAFLAPADDNTCERSSNQCPVAMNSDRMRASRVRVTAQKAKKQSLADQLGCATVSSRSDASDVSRVASAHGTNRLRR
ncbi:hypothetical protein SBV1_3580008 [Verrucomicrobia bacterium]|nr:hypothetical protein SBV1_3580008 [Verrucomicrobiota bacterium]